MKGLKNRWILADVNDPISCTPSCVHAGDPLDDKTDVRFWGVYAFVLDTLCERVKNRWI